MKRAVVVLVVIFATQLAFAQARWPKAEGVYVATTSSKIPAFPRVLSGYRAARVNHDFWGNSYDWEGSVRVGEDWTGLDKFPNTQNKCSHGVWMLRWRSGYGARVRTTKAWSEENAVGGKTGAFGFMYGHNCEQPLFRIVDNSNEDMSAVGDIYFEIKFWKAAP